MANILWFDVEPESTFGGIRLSGEAKAMWASVLLSVLALVVSTLAYYRTVGDDFEMSSAQVGLYNIASGEWQTVYGDSDAHDVSSAQWVGSDPEGRFIQVRLHNDGGEDVHLMSAGLVKQQSGWDFFGLREGGKSKLDTKYGQLLHCGPTAYAPAKLFKECGNSLGPKEAIWARINLSSDLLQRISVDRRAESLQFWVQIGSGDQYFDTDITLPPEAFT